MSCSHTHHCCENSCQIVENPDKPNEFFCPKCKRRFREEESFNWFFMLLAIAFGLIIIIVNLEQQQSNLTNNNNIEQKQL